MPPTSNSWPTYFHELVAQSVGQDHAFRNQFQHFHELVAQSVGQDHAFRNQFEDEEQCEEEERYGRWRGHGR